MLEFSSPLLNAAGSLGFSPPTNKSDLSAVLGAFITNPISLRPRKSGTDSQQINFPGGVMLHSGYPNPGLSSCIKKYGSQWARAQMPIIVHLLGTEPSEVQAASSRLEELENVMAIELSVGPDASGTLTRDLCIAAIGELPLITQLPFESALQLAGTAIDVGASALSFAPPRGKLLGAQSELIAGRLYGSSIFPQALQLIDALSGFEVPLLGSGGIYQKKQAEVMLKAGAQALQLDTLLWKTDTNINSWLPL
jgi:dihydroorotate dehydrogenase (NAD+) catalytic subunit